MKDFNEHKLDVALQELLGGAYFIERTTALTGGCIHETSHLRLRLHSNPAHCYQFVLKQAQTPQGGSDLSAEAGGLLALRAVLQQGGGREKCPQVRIPKPYALSRVHGYLVLEYLGQERRGAADLAARHSEEALATALATVHQFTDWQALRAEGDGAGRLSQFSQFSQLRSNLFGWSKNVYPAVPHKQMAPMRGTWLEFFRDYRLQPVLAATYRRGGLSRPLYKLGERLLGRLGNYLGEPRHAALVHGDLWSGNVMILAGGAGALIDPAVHLAHPETDLALSELFGRRSQRFYDVYWSLVGASPQYAERVPLYNLYHLLNHLYLFGKNYLGAVAAILRRYG